MKTYLVGGAVRDLLLGLDPKDRDYVVIGSTVIEMLDAGYSQVGKDFPVFLHPETGEEYALARRDRKIAPGYGGFSVDTDYVTLEQDLERRDLTINSMAMDAQGNVFDYYGGQADLEAKILRHTSDAFFEDPLRVVRLARFYARYKSLGFTVHEDTKHLCAMMVRTLDLDEISDERFWVELSKNFSEDHPEYFFEFLQEINALDMVSFFKRLFQTDVTPDRFDVVRDIAIACASKSDALDNFVALVQTDDYNFSGVSSKSAQIAIALNMLDRMCSKPGPEEVLGLFQKVRAFSEGTRGEDFLTALSIREEVRGAVSKPFSSKQFRAALRAARTVTAAPFAHLEGQEIGIQMNFARARKIQEVLFRK